MKIALVLYRVVKMGGLETRLHNYISWLMQHGHEVTVICQRYDHQTQWPGEIKLVRLSVGITPKIFRVRMFDLQLAAYMSKHVFDFSLSLERTSSQDMVLAASNHRGYMRALNKNWWWPNDYMQDLSEKHAYKNSKIILACSSLIKKDIAELMPLIDRKKIRILFPPLNPDKYHYMKRHSEERKELRDKLGMKAGVKYFLFVSNSHFRKGLDILLNVFSQLQGESLQLNIIGRPEVKASLSNVTYLGYRKDLEQFYQVSDFTIHPARYEPFGQVISESLQCGTPVIISRSVGAREVVDETEGVVIESLNDYEWVELLKRIHPDQFDVKPDFAERKKLTLDEHMSTIMEEWQKVKQVL